MKTNPEGIAICHHFEDCRLESYPDPKTGGDPWTIGWGHTAGVKEGDTCTQEQADEWFREDLGFAESIVSNKFLVHLNEDQFSALVSLIYNVGAGKIGQRDGIVNLKNGNRSTLHKMLHQGKIEEAAAQFVKWISPGTNVERGLLHRRVAERALFLSEDWRAALDLHIENSG